MKDKQVVALASGTAAVHLSLIGVGVEAGDEVICQSFTFCASSHPVTYLGAKPVFVDSERDTWNMDPELLETAIKDRVKKTGKKPKAIIVVYLYGMRQRLMKSRLWPTDMTYRSSRMPPRAWARAIADRFVARSANMVCSVSTATR